MGAMSNTQVKKVEEDITKIVESDKAVHAEIAPLSTAKKIKGLRAMFSEVYPDPVRIVSVGVPVNELVSNPDSPAALNTSVEFCGGTHLHRSSHIGDFCITSEEAIAKGIRRIVALTGPEATKALKKAALLDNELNSLKKSIDQKKLGGKEVSKAIVDLTNDISQAVIPQWKKEELRATLKELKKKLDSADKAGKAEQLAKVVEVAKGIASLNKGKPLIVHQLDAGSNTKALDSALKQVKSISPDTSAMFFSVDSDSKKIFCLCSVSKSGQEKGLKANEWLNSVCKVIDGKGGGKAESGQASGTNYKCVDKALAEASNFALNLLDNGGKRPSTSPSPGVTFIHSHPKSTAALVALKYSGKSLPTQEGTSFALVDQQVTLFDPLAAAFYLVPDCLRGGDSLSQANVVSWTSFANTDLHPKVSSLLYSIKESVSQVDDSKAWLMASLMYLEKVLLGRTYLVGERLTLADIYVAAILLPGLQMGLTENDKKPLVCLMRWFNTIVNQPQFIQVTGKGLLKGKAEGHKSQQKAAPKSEKAQKEVKQDIQEIEGEEVKKPKDPFAAFPKSKFDLDDFKRFYSNESEEKSVPYFWSKVDFSQWSLWFCEYKYPEELRQTFMSCNLITGMFQRLDNMRKHSFASVCLFGENNNSSISGVWLWRGPDLIFTLSDNWQVDYESYTWTKLDPSSSKAKALVHQYFSWVGTDSQGRKLKEGKIFK